MGFGGNPKRDTLPVHRRVPSGLDFPLSPDSGTANSHGARRVGAASPTCATFTFNGATISATAGDTIASAVLAHGSRVLRVMENREDLRGGWCMVGRCGDCLVVVDGTPNVRACITPVRDGMVVLSQFDLGQTQTDQGGSR